MRRSLRRMGGERGMTVVEVATAAAMGVVIVGAASRLSVSTMKDADGTYMRTGLATRAAETTAQIVRELQLATLKGEDLNANATLDNGEDTNRNGRLDSDWSLADGAAASTITFNSVVDGWLWSGPISYSVADGVLVRTENGSVREICRGVISFSLTRTGHLVDLELTLRASDRSGNVWTESSSRRADVRNL